MKDKKEEEKKVKCSFCNRELKKDDNGDYEECPECYSGCSDPSYHNGEPCDKSC